VPPEIGKVMSCFGKIDDGVSNDDRRAHGDPVPDMR
jgi:hypothetical protein